MRCAAENCGNEVEQSRWLLPNGGKRVSHKDTCSEACHNRLSYSKQYLDPVFRVKKIMLMAKNRAKEKELPFNLNIEYLMSLWEDNNGKCVLSGRKFVLEYGKRRVNKDTVSIDRIIPELGYVKGNVRLVTYHTNVALSEFGHDDLIELAKCILANVDGT